MKLQFIRYIAALSLCTFALPTKAEDPAALVALGNSYLNGEGKEKDLPKARELFQSAAELGSPQGKGLLGFMLAGGLGGPRNDRGAVRWIREAAETGLASAQLNYAGMLEAGRGTPRDLAAALSWYEKAAEQDSGPARLKLAKLHYLGTEDLPADHAKALPHVRKAALAGNPWAQNAFGTMLEFGQATQAKPSLARQYYLMAAEQGDAKGQSNLGRSFRYGTPGGRDPVLAYKWLRLSAMQGEVTAMMMLKDFAPVVSDAQKRQAEDRIRHFLERTRTVE